MWKTARHIWNITTYGVAKTRKKSFRAIKKKQKDKKSLSKKYVTFGEILVYKIQKNKNGKIKKKNNVKTNLIFFPF